MHYEEDPLIKEKTIRQIVHELRNPLTAIRIANETLEQADKHGGLTLGERSAYTGIIRKNIARIEGMIRKLIGPSETPSMPLRATNLCHIADIALSLASDRLFLKNIEVNKNYGNGCIIQGYPQQLSIAFLNIILNAIEASKKERGKIWIAIYPTNAAITVVIKDNGKGMSAEMLSHVFEPGFTDKIGGLGLGLTTVKEVIELHEATIKVDSELGIGTSFVMAFKSN